MLLVGAADASHTGQLRRSGIHRDGPRAPGVVGGAIVALVEQGVGRLRSSHLQRSVHVVRVDAAVDDLVEVDVHLAAEVGDGARELLIDLGLGDHGRGEGLEHRPDGGILEILRLDDGAGRPLVDLVDPVEADDLGDVLLGNAGAVGTEEERQAHLPLRGADGQEFVGAGKIQVVQELLALRGLTLLGIAVEVQDEGVEPDHRLRASRDVVGVLAKSLVEALARGRELAGALQDEVEVRSRLHGLGDGIELGIGAATTTGIDGGRDLTLDYCPDRAGNREGGRSIRLHLGGTSFLKYQLR